MFDRTIWWQGDLVEVIDQTRLPHDVTTAQWRSLEDAARGISTMQVRGAPLIGVAAAHGMALAMKEDPAGLDGARKILLATRPTAVNLRWALDRVYTQLSVVEDADRAASARELAITMAQEDVAACHAIGMAGLGLVQAAHERLLVEGHERPVNILTHCNAGWLACVKWGTATAPIYLAHREEVPVHVWVSETRPRNQGASLTAWELRQAGVPHTLVVDNAAGHLMQQGLVDLVITGADRVAANGDAANKIGTYLKALAAQDCRVPFYIAAPASTFDGTTIHGTDIPIEERDPMEVLEFGGHAVAPSGTVARNWGFDVTPAAMINGYITDRGLLSGERISQALTPDA